MTKVHHPCTSSQSEHYTVTEPTGSTYTVWVNRLFQYSSLSCTCIQGTDCMHIKFVEGRR